MPTTARSVAVLVNPGSPDVGRIFFGDPGTDSVDISKQYGTDGGRTNYPSIYGHGNGRAAREAPQEALRGEVPRAAERPGERPGERSGVDGLVIGAGPARGRSVAPPCPGPARAAVRWVTRPRRCWPTPKGPRRGGGG